MENDPLPKSAGAFIIGDRSRRNDHLLNRISAGGYIPVCKKENEGDFFHKNKSTQKSCRHFFLTASIYAGLDSATSGNSSIHSNGLQASIKAREL